MLITRQLKKCGTNMVHGTMKIGNK